MSDSRSTLESLERPDLFGDRFVWSQHARLAGRIAGLQYLSYCLIDEVATRYGRGVSMPLDLLENLADSVAQAEAASSASADSGTKGENGLADYSRLLERLGSDIQHEESSAQDREGGEARNEDSVAFFLFRDRRRLAGTIVGLELFLSCLIGAIQKTVGGTFEYQVLDRLADDFERITEDSGIDQSSKAGVEEIYSNYSLLHTGQTIGEYAAEYCERWTDPYGIERRAAPEESARR